MATEQTTTTTVTSNGRVVDEVRSSADCARNCTGNTCRNLMIATAVFAILAAILALTGGIMDLCVTGDATTNGTLATIGGSFALIAFFLAAIASYQCRECKVCPLFPTNCGCNYP